MALSAEISSRTQTPFVPFPPLLSSSIYRISPDGAPEELWTSRDDVVYALALNSDGRLLAGTGNNGALLAIDGRGVFAQLAKAGSAQITGIARSASGKIFLCTANPGKVFSVGPEYRTRRHLRITFLRRAAFFAVGPPRVVESSARASGKSAGASGEPRLEFFVRTGNTEDPGKEWSRWFGPYSKSGTSVEAPPARFAQWKAVIHDGRPGDGIEWVSFAYLPRNVAPVIDGIAVQDPDVRVQRRQSDSVRAAAASRDSENASGAESHRSGDFAKRFARENSSSRRRDSCKKATNPCCGARTTITTTSCASPSTIAAKMKPSGNS